MLYRKFGEIRKAVKSNGRKCPNIATGLSVFAEAMEKETHLSLAKLAITTFWNVRREGEGKSQSEDTADGKCLLLYGSFSFKTFALHIHRLKSKHYRRN